MSILIKIAWRNIWRNPRRSWVLITALAVGVFSFLGAVAYIDGFSIQMVDSAINLQGGHIQVTGRGYHENPTIRTYVPDVPRVEQAIAEIDEVDAIRYAPQATTPGMINSAEQASGVVISGVDPVREAEVSSISTSIVEGAYLSPEGTANEVVIGEGKGGFHELAPVLVQKQQRGRGLDRLAVAGADAQARLGQDLVWGHRIVDAAAPIREDHAARAGQQSVGEDVILTEDMVALPAVQDVLQNPPAPFEATLFTTTLKGIEETFTLHRLVVQSE